MTPDHAAEVRELEAWWALASPAEREIQPMLRAFFYDRAGACVHSQYMRTFPAEFNVPVRLPSVCQVREADGTVRPVVSYRLVRYRLESAANACAIYREIV